MPERISVVGLSCDGAPLSPAAARALSEADLVVGAPRHLDMLSASLGPTVRTGRLGANLAAACDLIAAEPGQVSVLSSGDPGFFGVVRVLAERFGARRLDVHPGVSSVAVAFARIGIPWDDAVVVSAHGRPLDAAVAEVQRPGAPPGKVAVLTSPDNPPESLGKALLSSGSPATGSSMEEPSAGGPSTARVYVCSRLGSASESVTKTDLTGLAGRIWDPLSVVILLRTPERVATHPQLAWGLPEEAFEHRGGMITKSEVRAVALGRLELPPTGVFWDVGAGSASVAVEVARLAPGLDAYAVEHDADQVERCRRNAAVHGVAVHVVAGTAPDALEDLPDPDRAFVGGGGITVLDAVLSRLRPGGRVVATYTAVDRAVEAEARLGALVQLAVSRGDRLPDGALRLVAQNPVFVVWGPRS